MVHSAINGNTTIVGIRHFPVKLLALKKHFFRFGIFQGPFTNTDGLCIRDRVCKVIIYAMDPDFKIFPVVRILVDDVYFACSDRQRLPDRGDRTMNIVF